MNTENSYNVKTVDGIHKLKEVAPYSPYVDVVLAAKMLGWNIDVDQLQKHGDEEYDKSDWGNEDQADNGGNEGHVVISNEQNSAEIQTGNGHRLSKSHVTINGRDVEANAKVYDGKTYVQFNFINEIMKLPDSNNYSPIKLSDISPARSYENIGPFNMPI